MLLKLVSTTLENLKNKEFCTFETQNRSVSTLEKKNYMQSTGNSGNSAFIKLRYLLKKHFEDYVFLTYKMFI